MNVAALELCKELCELSGWDDVRDHWYMSMTTQGKWIPLETKRFSTPVAELYQQGNACPAYDLGYLLRKLPTSVAVYSMPSGKFRCWLGVDTEEADTPEDAACQLAIELFKQGILKRD